MGEPTNGAIGDITGLPLWVTKPFHHLPGCPGGTPMVLFGGVQSCVFCIPCNVAYNLALDAAREAITLMPWSSDSWQAHDERVAILAAIDALHTPNKEET